MLYPIFTNNHVSFCIYIKIEFPMKYCIIFYQICIAFTILLVLAILTIVGSLLGGSFLGR